MQAICRLKSNVKMIGMIFFLFEILYLFKPKGLTFENDFKEKD